MHSDSNIDPCWSIQHLIVYPMVDVNPLPVSLLDHLTTLCSQPVNGYTRKFTITRYISPHSDWSSDHHLRRRSHSSYLLPGVSCPGHLPHSPWWMCLHCWPKKRCGRFSTGEYILRSMQAVIKLLSSIASYIHHLLHCLWYMAGLRLMGQILPSKMAHCLCSIVSGGWDYNILG